MSYLDQKPTVGRIVHFYDQILGETGHSGPFAAIITDVIADDCLSLMVFYPRGKFLIPANIDQQRGPNTTERAWTDGTYAVDLVWRKGTKGEDTPEGARHWWEWPPREV